MKKFRMKLVAAQVQNFRSIVDSGTVNIDDRLTVLVGKNEQGKTTFLRALYSANPRVTYSRSDLPTHLLAELEKKAPSEVPIISLTYRIDGSDAQAITSAFENHAQGVDLEHPPLFRVTKYFDGSRAFAWVATNGSATGLTPRSPKISPLIARLMETASALRVALEAHAARFPTFAPHLPSALAHIDSFIGSNFAETAQIPNLLQTVSVALTSVPGQDEQVQQSIAVFVTQAQSIASEIANALQHNALATVEQSLPNLLYHSTTIDRIPNQINVSEFVANPDAVSRGMANLCGVAGLSIQKIQQLSTSTDQSEIQTYEDNYRADVSGGLNEYWSQETYSVHFQFTSGLMYVSISDGTYERRIPPTERSEGFQWYLSFYMALLNEVTAGHSTIFLLDNPALELHADGQRDIKRFLEEKLPPSAQIIYVTHSPAMIDPFHLEQVRKVELLGGMVGTKVSDLQIKTGDDFDLFEPVRMAIGASIASSLVLNHFNVLVEGAADKPLIEAAIAISDSDKRDRVFVNGSLSESKDDFLATFYKRAHLPLVIFVDADSSGRDITGRLRALHFGDEHFVDLKALFPDKNGDFEIEDTIHADDYHDAVRRTYPDRDVQVPEGDGKRTRLYASEFKARHNLGFNKRQVAETLKRMIIEAAVTQNTKDALGLIAGAIIENLTAQISAKQQKDQ